MKTSDNANPSPKQKAGKIDIKEESGILTEAAIGEVSIEDVLNSLQLICDKENIGRCCYGLIFDYSNACFNFSVDHHKNIVNVLKFNHHVFERMNIAFVADTPYNIVIATLVARSDQRLKIKLFTTLEAAERWVSDAISNNDMPTSE